MTPEEQDKFDTVSKQFLVLRARAESGRSFHDNTEVDQALAARAVKTDAGDWELPATAVTDLAAAKPHWLKPAGTGARGSTPNTPPAPKKYSELLKPENADELLEYLKTKTPADMDAIRRN